MTTYHDSLLPREFRSLDFTGTGWDAKAECNQAGLRFSDSDTPYPTTLVYAHTNGSWSHSAGNGWQPAATTNDAGPSILIPLVRPGNWQLDAIIDFSGAAVDTYSRVMLGAITPTNHVQFYATILDNQAGVVRYLCHLNTNDGNDTYSNRYTGVALDGAAEREVRIRAFSGTVGVWDDQDNAWHDYVGRQNVGHAYTPCHAFIQVTKHENGTLNVMYLASLKLMYLV